MHLFLCYTVSCTDKNTLRVIRRLWGRGEDSHLPQLVLLGITWFHLNSLREERGLTLASLGLTSTHLVSLGLTWSQLVSLALTWFHLVSLGLTLFHLNSFGFTWFHLVSQGMEKGKPATEKGKRKAPRPRISPGSHYTYRLCVRTRGTKRNGFAVELNESG